MRFFHIYEFAAPLLLFPLAYWLWLDRYDGNHRLVVLVLSIPILFAYVIPGLGTNWLKLWRFNSRLRLGRFRPQHGFLFGTATSLFGLVCLPFPPRDFAVWEFLRSAFVMCSVLAFWNWVYDLAAIRAGVIVVYNRKYHENRGPEAIASDYCPVFFGTFGLVYGAAVRLCEYVVIELARSDLYGLLFVACNAVVLTSPVLAYVAYSLLTSGETGLRSYEGVTHEG
ncbi:MAG: hypothetical protein KY476_10000 [Planctomycetes bacterium]|nr:hypothetical protein [Planctomycetota bacterium]